MGPLCYMCPKWNDWLGRCDAPFWCSDKEDVNESYERRKQSSYEVE